MSDRVDKWSLPEDPDSKTFGLSDKRFKSPLLSPLYAEMGKANYAPASAHSATGKSTAPGPDPVVSQSKRAGASKPANAGQDTKVAENDDITGVPSGFTPSTDEFVDGPEKQPDAKVDGLPEPGRCDLASLEQSSDAQIASDVSSSDTTDYDSDDLPILPAESRKIMDSVGRSLDGNVSSKARISRTKEQPVAGTLTNFDRAAAVVTAAAPVRADPQAASSEPAKGTPSSDSASGTSSSSDEASWCRVSVPTTETADDQPASSGRAPAATASQHSAGAQDSAMAQGPAAPLQPPATMPHQQALQPQAPPEAQMFQALPGLGAPTTVEMPPVSTQLQPDGQSPVGIVNSAQVPTVNDLGFNAYVAGSNTNTEAPAYPPYLAAYSEIVEIELAKIGFTHFMTAGKGAPDAQAAVASQADSLATVTTSPRAPTFPSTIRPMSTLLSSFQLRPNLEPSVQVGPPNVLPRQSAPRNPRRTQPPVLLQPRFPARRYLRPILPKPGPLERTLAPIMPDPIARATAPEPSIHVAQNAVADAVPTTTAGSGVQSSAQPADNQHGVQTLPLGQAALLPRRAYVSPYPTLPGPGEAPLTAQSYIDTGYDAYLGEKGAKLAESMARYENAAMRDKGKPATTTSSVTAAKSSTRVATSTATQVQATPAQAQVRASGQIQSHLQAQNPTLTTITKRLQPPTIVVTPPRSTSSALASVAASASLTTNTVKPLPCTNKLPSSTTQLRSTEKLPSLKRKASLSTKEKDRSSTMQNPVIDSDESMDDAPVAAPAEETINTASASDMATPVYGGSSWTAINVNAADAESAANAGEATKTGDTTDEMDTTNETDTSDETDSSDEMSTAAGTSTADVSLSSSAPVNATAAAKQPATKQPAKKALRSGRPGNNGKASGRHVTFAGPVSSSYGMSIGRSLATGQAEVVGPPEQSPPPEAVYWEYHIFRSSWDDADNTSRDRVLTQRFLSLAEANAAARAEFYREHGGQTPDCLAVFDEVNISRNPKTGMMCFHGTSVERGNVHVFVERERVLRRRAAVRAATAGELSGRQPWERLPAEAYRLLERVEGTPDEAVSAMAGEVYTDIACANEAAHARILEHLWAAQPQVPTAADKADLAELERQCRDEVAAANEASVGVKVELQCSRADSGREADLQLAWTVRLWVVSCAVHGPRN